ncbi:frataxin [Anaeramoeba flamelloides]|uniref:Frataxin n=1 Tax=Anaeramoeba flamelloides TaxID=1746091 RepID=A0AAV8A057_9EUKA|nr:frataxin [Anaeramoeba flamelloides]
MLQLQSLVKSSLTTKFQQSCVLSSLNKSYKNIFRQSSHQIQTQDYFKLSSTLLSRSFISQPKKSIINFDFVANQKLEEIEDYFQLYEDDLMDLDSNYETSLEQGVLNIKLGEPGQYVINKHSGTKQIWFASTISGPMKFSLDMADSKWKNKKGEAIMDVIERELKQILQKNTK